MTMLSPEEIRARALRAPKVVKEFRAFVLRGNVVDLAVGVVMGAAFATLVKSMVENVITPITGVFGELPRFTDLSFKVGRSKILYGNFINDLLSFLIIAVVVFFCVMKPLNRVLAVHRSCPECLSNMPRAATRCAHCGIAVPPEDQELVTGPVRP
jgi:large conductance mechanosensitive channel